MAEQSELSSGTGWKGWIDTLKFDADGLIPAVIQDAETDQVLMVGYMNREIGRASCRERV